MGDIAETRITHYKVGGHSHNGENSTKVDFSNYTLDDLGPLKDAIKDIIGGTINGGDTGPGGPGGVPILSYTPKPRNLTLTTGVTITETGEVVWIEATWEPPDPNDPYSTSVGSYEVILFKEDRVTGIRGVAQNQVTSSTSIKFQPVEANTYYGVEVRGINRVGFFSEILGPVYIITAKDSTPPAKVTGVEASPGVTSLQVTWDAVEDFDVINGRGQYEVNIARDTAFTIGLQTVLVGGTIASFTGLTGGDTYYIRVRAIDSSGNPGVYSDLINATIGGFAPPTGVDSNSVYPFEYTFDNFSYTDWDVIFGSSNAGLTFSGGLYGDNVLRATGVIGLMFKSALPYDPSKLYRVNIRVRQTTDPTGGGKSIYAGVAGVAGDEVTLSDRNGGTSHLAQFHVCSDGGSITAGTNWTELEGYYSGFGAFLGPGSNNPNTPSGLEANVRYVKPIFILNYNNADGVAEIDSISIEQIGLQVGTNELYDGSVTTGKIVDSAITGPKIASGAITTNKLNVIVGGGNSILNSSFEADSDANGVADSWSSSGTGSFSFSVGSSNGVTHALKAANIVVTGMTAGQTTYLTQTVTAATGVPIAGAQYVFSAYVKLLSLINCTFRLRTEWYNVSNTLLNTFDTDINSLTSGVFQRFTQNNTVPANATYAKVYFMLVSTGSGGAGIAVIDSVQLEQGDLATAYAPLTDELLPGVVNANHIAANSISTLHINAAGLDASVIKTGFLDANVIAAGTITTTKLSVATGLGNLIPNSSVEYGISDWTTGGVGSIARDTTPIPQHGSFLASVTNNTASSNTLELYAPIFPVTSLTNYAVSIYFRPDGTYNSRVKVHFFFADGTFATAQATQSAATASQWQRRTFNVTTPFNAVYAKVGISCDAVPVGAKVRADAAQAELGSTTTAYLPAPIDLRPGTISGDVIIANTINGAKIVAGSITTEKLAAGSITADKIGTGTLNAATITLGATGELIAGVNPNYLRISSAGLEAYSAGVRQVFIPSNGGTSSFKGNIDASNITGSQLAGNTIYGGRIATAFSGRRIELNASEQNYIRFYSGFTSETSSGQLFLSLNNQGLSNEAAGLALFPPVHNNRISNIATFTMTNESADGSLKSFAFLGAARVDIQANARTYAFDAGGDGHPRLGIGGRGYVKALTSVDQIQFRNSLDTAYCGIRSGQIECTGISVNGTPLTPGGGGSGNFSGTFTGQVIANSGLYITNVFAWSGIPEIWTSVGFRGIIYMNGNSIDMQGGFVVNQSAREKKKNISLVTKTLDAVRNAPVYTYKYIDGPDKTRIGIMFDEAPEFVKHEDDKIDYFAMVGYLWGAVRELAEEVDKLKSKVGN